MSRLSNTVRQLLGESYSRFPFFGAITMIVSAKNKTMLLGGVAFLALSASANAQSIIDTIPQWNGIQSIQSWGVTDTATYGQTITPTAGQTRLSSFTFELARTSGTASQYQAFVYQWDPTNQRITGSALFSSSVFTAAAAGSTSTGTAHIADPASARRCRC